MKKLDELEKDVRELSSEELADFRAWFLEYDAQYDSGKKCSREN